MKFLLLALLIATNSAFATDDMGGISSGGDDPTRVLSCVAEIEEGVQVVFGFTNMGPRGIGSEESVDFSKMLNGKEIAAFTVKMDSSTDFDFDTGELVLSIDGRGKKYSYNLEIFPTPEERDYYYYYKARLYSADPFFGSLTEHPVSCKTYSQKAPPDPGSVEI